MQEEADITIIGKLLTKFPALSRDELQVLEAWRQKDNNNQIFEAIIESRQADLARMITILEGMDAVWERRLADIAAAPVKKMKWGNNWKLYAAAACVSIVLISGVLWLHRKKENEVAKTEEKVIPIARDAEPGKYKAKLTLADGSVVILDSISNKSLGQQGGTNVVNENGRLVYKAKTHAAEVLYNVLSTSKGEMYPLVLADGSKIWLNSQSSVRYPVSVPANQPMDISITGEVFFDIVHNPQRQFTITVNGVDIDDIGTQFNVNAYTDEDNIKVTLIEGSARIRKGEKMVLVTRGQQALASKAKDDNKIQVIDGADTEKAIAWKNGQFKFSKDDLKTVMRQLARWYDIDVVYEGNILKRQVMGTIPRNLNLSQVLEILASSDIHFKIEGKKLVVTP
jgi:ferric-dicitrate binding protein FerR (iron transport regulator)